MIVMKFGGSSLADGGRIRRVARIIVSHKKRKPLIIASALKGVTNDLLWLAASARKGDVHLLKTLRRRHDEVIDSLGLKKSILDEAFEDLGTLIQEIVDNGESTRATLDHVASFGEVFSTRLLAGHLRSLGIKTSRYDASEAGLLTDHSFGAATPLPEAEKAIRRRLKGASGMIIITGFSGLTLTGEITTLGRNGSDFSATIFGAALGAEEVQIWSDTDGIMTADPRLVPDARPIATLSFDEACELAYYGGQVLHPHTLLPALRDDIPIRVLNTFKPKYPGTIISPHPGPSRPGIKSIAFRKHQTIVNISSPRMLLGSGFLGRIFGVFQRHNIALDMVSTSEVSVSMTVNKPAGLKAALKELTDEFQVTVEEDKAILCVVGEGIRKTPGIASEVFGAVKTAKVNVLMISQGASKINLAFVIENREIPKTVRALHRRYFKRRS